MATEFECRLAAQAFSDKWLSRAGRELSDTHIFWLELAGRVLNIGFERLFDLFVNEKPVKLGVSSKASVGNIDLYIPSTKVLIEQKGSQYELSQKHKQADGTQLTALEQALRYNSFLPPQERARYIVVCNFHTFMIYDLKAQEEAEMAAASAGKKLKGMVAPSVVLLKNLPSEFYRLRCLVSDDSTISPQKQELSIKGAAFMAKLYELLREQFDDPDSPENLHSLSQLCVRLLFCLYAEDAGLLSSPKMFSDYLRNAHPDYMRLLLCHLFETFNTKLDLRSKYEPPLLRGCPYVNGELFADESLEIPFVTSEVVEMLLSEGGTFRWSDISPTIFGALFENTLNPEKRSHHSWHYTSVENIHKVIDPLFLDQLKDEFRGLLNLRGRQAQAKALKAFQQKIAALKFLDPACGSGNFLTEAYLSLRRLENDVLRALRNLGALDLENCPVKVSAAQFFGIELNDFAVAVARVALCIAETQMLAETNDLLGQNYPVFPLSSAPHIMQGNALVLDWEQVMPIDTHQAFIMGNPPFSGARIMGSEQKKEMLQVFGKQWPNVGDLDYVCAWFKRASDLILKHVEVRAAFVATNSICQGSSVANLWEGLFQRGIEIGFAYVPFAWISELKDTAHVSCVIVAIQSQSENEHKAKYVFMAEGTRLVVPHINAYLTPAPNVFVSSRRYPIFPVPIGGIGNKPIDGGNYLFSPKEKDEFLKLEPQAAPFFHRWYGAEEFINGKERFCLWLGDCSEEELAALPLCRERIAAVQQYRLQSSSAVTRKLADKPTRFHVENMPQSNFLVVPEVSSSRRDYIPIGFMSPEDGLCSNLLKLFPDASLYHFSVLSSSVHVIWMRAVCGRIGVTLRYSINLVYNNFPWPKRVHYTLKRKLEQAATKILQVRKAHEDMPLAQLYNPDTMPDDLLQAHKENDALVKRAYGFEPELDDNHVLIELFVLYRERVAELKESKEEP